MDRLVGKAQSIIDRFVVAEDCRVWLGRMSIWYSLTEEQALTIAPPKALEPVDPLGDLEMCLRLGSDGRYSMHTLVRKAASSMLTPEQLQEAQEHLVRAMAEVGWKLDALRDGDRRVMWERVRADLPNILRLEHCPFPKEERVGVGLLLLSHQLYTLGYTRGVVVACEMVSRASVMCRGPSTTE